MHGRTSERGTQLAQRLAQDARLFYERGWLMGTAGNFSAVLEPAPLRLLITRSGVDKGSLTPDQFLVVDADGGIVEGTGPASDETALHLAIVERTRAQAVYHTHSMWCTLLTSAERTQTIELAPHEMLKGLRGVKTHDHHERLPVLANTQDYGQLRRAIEGELAAHPNGHAVLLSRHGLYTWGDSPDEAKRHIEILEFLLEAHGRLGGE